MTPSASLLVVVCLSGAMAALVLTPVARHIAARWQLVDNPDRLRKRHDRPVPLGGGVVLLAGTVAAIAVPVMTSHHGQSFLREGVPHVLWLLAAGAVIVLLGLADDRAHLSARCKMLGQLGAAVLVVSAGLTIRRIELFHCQVELGLAAVPFTLFWMLGAINALNLLDGSDGVAVAVGVVLSLSLAAMALMLPNRGVEAVVALAFAGVLIGFLFYNFPPASIYLGDSGSMLVGLIAGALALRICLTGPTTIALATPTALFAIPILDTGMAILRRRLAGRSICSADRGHLHHCLLERGLSRRRTVLCIAGLCACTALAALASVYHRNELLAMGGVVAVVGILIGTRGFGHVESRLLTRKLARGIRFTIASAVGSPTPRPRIVFLNRSYWPDVEATGQLLTELCESLAQWFDVTVVAGQPNRNPGRKAFPSLGRMTRRRVDVRRVLHSRFSKRSILGRSINYVSYLVAAAFRSALLRRPSVLVTETDPPLLCLLGLMLRWRFRCRLVVYMQDVYPDVAIVVGKLPEGRFSHWVRRALYSAYRRADLVVVLSEDMKARMLEIGVAPPRIACVPNWVDTKQIQPLKLNNSFRRRHGMADRFVVMYSGNLGLTQPLDSVLAAASLLRNRTDIVFAFVGDGAARQTMQMEARRMELPNVRFIDYQPKESLAQSLSAADVHLVPLDRRLAPCLMPSKLYGALASGSPVIAMAPPACELARIVTQHGVGKLVGPRDPQGLARTLCWCVENRARLRHMGRAARELAVRKFDRQQSVTAFRDLLTKLVAGLDREVVGPRGERYADANDSPDLSFPHQRPTVYPNLPTIPREASLP